MNLSIKVKMAGGIFGIVVGNFVSKGLGLVREVLFANWFGTGETAAAFRIAQTAYLLPTQALIGDALSAGLLPLYKRLSVDSHDGGRVLLLVASVYGLLFSALVTSLLFLYADSIVYFIAPGSAGTAQVLAASLLQVMALATPFFVLGGMISFVEASFGSYGGIAWRPVLLNIGSIVGAALVVYTGNTMWMATALVFAHVLFFGWTVLELRKLDRLMPLVRPSWTILFQISTAFIRNMFPLLGLPLIAQVNVVTERIVSSWIGIEVIPAVDYSRFLVDTMVQLIAMPLGVLTMAKHGGAAEDVMSTHVRRLTVMVVLLSFPIATFLGQHAESIVRILFARGAFSEQSIYVTSDVLRWMGGALGFTITGYYLVKVLNSQMRNVEALMITLLAAVCSMLMNLLFWKILGAQVVGVAVAIFNFVLFSLCFTRLRLWREMSGVLIWVACGCLIQIAVTAIMLKYLIYPFGLLFGGVFFVCNWVVFFSLVSEMRSSVYPLLLRVPFFRNVAARIASSK